MSDTLDYPFRDRTVVIRGTLTNGVTLDLVTPGQVARLLGIEERVVLALVERLGLATYRHHCLDARDGHDRGENRHDIPLIRWQDVPLLRLWQRAEGLLAALDDAVRDTHDYIPSRVRHAGYALAEALGTPATVEDGVVPSSFAE